MNFYKVQTGFQIVDPSGVPGTPIDGISTTLTDSVSKLPTDKAVLDAIEVAKEEAEASGISKDIITSYGDLIQGNACGEPETLGKGTKGQVLTSTENGLEWQTGIHSPNTEIAATDDTTLVLTGKNLEIGQLTPYGQQGITTMDIEMKSAGMVTLYSESSGVVASAPAVDLMGSVYVNTKASSITNTSDTNITSFANSGRFSVLTNKSPSTGEYTDAMEIGITGFQVRSSSYNKQESNGPLTIKAQAQGEIYTASTLTIHSGNPIYIKTDTGAPIKLSTESSGSALAYVQIQGTSISLRTNTDATHYGETTYAPTSISTGFTGASSPTALTVYSSSNIVGSAKSISFISAVGSGDSGTASFNAGAIGGTTTISGSTIQLIGAPNGAMYIDSNGIRIVDVQHPVSVNSAGFGVNSYGEVNIKTADGDNILVETYPDGGLITLKAAWENGDGDVVHSTMVLDGENGINLTTPSVIELEAEDTIALTSESAIELESTGGQINIKDSGGSDITILCKPTNAACEGKVLAGSYYVELDSVGNATNKSSLRLEPNTVIGTVNASGPGASMEFTARSDQETSGTTETRTSYFSIHDTNGITASTSYGPISLSTPGPIAVLAGPSIFLSTTALSPTNININGSTANLSASAKSISMIAAVGSNDSGTASFNAGSINGTTTISGSSISLIGAPNGTLSINSTGMNIILPTLPIMISTTAVRIPVYNRPYDSTRTYELMARDTTEGYIDKVPMADVFAAGSPMTSYGDLIYGGASGTPSRLAIGSTGQVLTVNASGVPEWANGGGGGAVQSVSDTDSISLTLDQNGDLTADLNVDNSSGNVSLTVGNDGLYGEVEFPVAALDSGSPGILVTGNIVNEYSIGIVISNRQDNILEEVDDDLNNGLYVPPSELDGLITTAGDLIVGGASGEPEALSAGTEGQVLTINASGVPSWGNAGGTNWYCGSFTTANRPANPTEGQYGYDTTIDCIIYYIGNYWRTAAGAIV